MTEPRYRVLGPLEVWDGERWSPVPPAKWRALLAVLLIDANRVVSTGRLTGQLWGERPPPSAGKLLQLYVGRLRRLLPDTAGTRLVTRFPGYQLRTSTGEQDRDLFDQLVEAGDRALRGGEPERSIGLLDTALSLWSGQALADVSGVPDVEAEKVRLEERRLAATEVKMDALLACGRPLAVLPDLEAMVTHHPLREGLRGQLMVALYRSGRQADALLTYRDLQRRLDVELGIRPAPRIQRLHLAILRADSALEYVAAG